MKIKRNLATILCVSMAASGCSTPSRQSSTNEPDLSAMAPTGWSAGGAELPMEPTRSPSAQGFREAILSRPTFNERWGALFMTVRRHSQAFLKELRQNDPVFKVPADAGGRDVYVITRHKDVIEAFGGVGRPNPNIGVTYAPVMDPTVKGAYMLGRDVDQSGVNMHPANAEKAAQHDILGHIFNTDGSKTSAAPRIRELIANLTREAIAEGIRGDQLDVAAAVSRRVPLGMVSEYFGFYPPTPEKAAEWSRATQHAFFHNPFQDRQVAGRAIQAGTEMQAWLEGRLFPEIREQLGNQRPLNNAVSQFLHAHRSGNPWKEKPEHADRVTTNVMGLLVGSGETSHAAIVQSLSQLLKRPEHFRRAVALARRAARRDASRADQEAFDRYVWEALRFEPINPWVGRIAMREHTITTEKEGSREPVQVTIPRGSVVLISTESAMHDSAAFPEPEIFKTDRDLNSYIHVSAGYHRCLGDDVVMVMIPEVLKQIFINLDDVRAVADPDKRNGPFPETFTITFKNAKTRAVSVSNVARANDVLRGGRLRQTLAKFGGDSAGARATELISAASEPMNGDARDTLAGFIAQTLPSINAAQACVSGDLPTVETLPPRLKNVFCATPTAFRSCYFIQRTAGRKSPQHAYNYCVYGKNTLEARTRSNFEREMRNQDAFSFLKYQ